MADVKIYCFVFPGDSLPSEAQVRAALKRAYPDEPYLGKGYPVEIVRVTDATEMDEYLRTKDSLAIILTHSADDVARRRSNEDPPIIVS